MQISDKPLETVMMLSCFQLLSITTEISVAFWQKHSHIQERHGLEWGTKTCQALIIDSQEQKCTHVSALSFLVSIQYMEVETCSLTPFFTTVITPTGFYWEIYYMYDMTSLRNDDSLGLTYCSGC